MLDTDFCHNFKELKNFSFKEGKTSELNCIKVSRFLVNEQKQFRRNV